MERAGEQQHSGTQNKNTAKAHRCAKVIQEACGGKGLEGS